MKKHSRRTFLQTAGAGFAAATLSRSSSAAPTSSALAPVSASPHKDGLVDMVNLMQGTESTPVFSRGNTLPIVTMPFGMAHWTIQTTSESGPWFFDPTKRRIEGIRCTHQLSPWLADYGEAVFLPYSKVTSLDPDARSASYIPAETIAQPHFLQMDLLRYQTRLELAATERCAAMRLTFAKGEGGFIIDLPGADAKLQRQGNLLLATVHANSGGVAPGFATYYVLEADVPFGEFTVEFVKHRRVSKVSLAVDAAHPVATVRIATSFISHEQAKRNLKNEIGGKSFDAVKNASRQVWNDHLGRALVEGGTEDQQRVFYSGMYRALLFPRIWYEYDAAGKPQHWSPYTGKLTPGVMYADHGYWDVYRAWNPWMSILFPERLGEILQAWVNAADEGGWLPQFPCPGYRACMTGSLIDSVFADAVVKGIPGFDKEAAYKYLYKHATQPGDPAAGYGRRGIEQYLKLGYCPAGEVAQSVAETTDAAYGDFCIAQVARALGKEDDAKMFEKRSSNWRHVFDPEVKFFRGKKTDGTWLAPFDPHRWGDPYVEGSAWQHRWDAPHQPEELFAAMGGHAYAAAQLELMLTQPAVFEVGIYEREIHEMSEMAAVPFGQYAQSNQPVHHVLYMFAVAGRSDRLQYWARRVMNELYTPDVFPGDEDTGSMSAWYLLSAMGFFSMCPGKPEYILGSPLFDRVTLTLPGGRKSVIEARNNSAENVYVQRCTLNGKPVEGISISHDDVCRGMKLEFTMGPNPKA
jgi:predicted alpha-1,2-mannosidase